MVAAALLVKDDQRQELGWVASSSVLPHRQVVQAQALLWAADGVANEDIARRCQVDSDTVRRWRNVSPTGVSMGSARSPRVGAGSLGCRRTRCSGWSS